MVCLCQKISENLTAKFKIGQPATEISKMPFFVEREEKQCLINSGKLVITRSTFIFTAKLTNNKYNLNKN